MADPTITYKGKPCKRGHDGTRYLSNGSCVECSVHPGRRRNHGYSHGGANPHPLYQVWSGMIARCENPNHNAYKNYGARGIRVCDRWRYSFPTFLADILNEIGERPNGHTLDRIDNDDHYRPGNMRWATRKTQNRNRRATLLTIEDVRLIREIYANWDRTKKKNGASAFLANACGVRKEEIWQIITNKIWKE